MFSSVPLPTTTSCKLCVTVEWFDIVNGDIECVPDALLRQEIRARAPIPIRLVPVFHMIDAARWQLGRCRS